MYAVLLVASSFAILYIFIKPSICIYLSSRVSVTMAAVIARYIVYSTIYSKSHFQKAYAGFSVG